MKLKQKRFRDTPDFGNAVVASVAAVVIGAVLYLTPVKAETITLAPIDVVGEVQDCMPAYYTAELIMQYRQDGLPLDTTLALFDESPKSTEIVKKAFRLSQFSSEKYQKQAVKEFAESQYNLCEDE